MGRADPRASPTPRRERDKPGQDAGHLASPQTPARNPHAPHTGAGTTAVGEDDHLAPLTGPAYPRGIVPATARTRERGQDDGHLTPPQTPAQGIRTPRHSGAIATSVQDAGHLAPPQTPGQGIRTPHTPARTRPPPERAITSHPQWDGPTRGASPPPWFGRDRGGQDGGFSGLRGHLPWDPYAPRGGGDAAVGSRRRASWGSEGVRVLGRLWSRCSAGYEWLGARVGRVCLLAAGGVRGAGAG